MCLLRFSRLFNKTPTFYTTALNVSVLPLVEIDHVTRYCLTSVAPINAYWQFSLALDDKNNIGILSQALGVIGSLGKLMCKLHISPCDQQISSGNLSHVSAINGRTLLFKWATNIGRTCLVVRVTGLNVKKLYIYIYIYIYIISTYVIKALFFLFSPTFFPIKHKSSSP